jgi:hypothetical protein
VRASWNQIVKPKTALDKHFSQCFFVPGRRPNETLFRRLCTALAMFIILAGANPCQAARRMKQEGQPASRRMDGFIRMLLT